MDENTASQLDAILGINEAAAAEAQPEQPAAAPPEPPQAAETPPETPVKLAKTREVLERARMERERRKLQDELKSAKDTAIAEAYDELRDLAKRDPVRFYREVVGLDIGQLKDVAAPLYYDHMGEKAPEQLKQQNERLVLERRIADLEAKLAATEQSLTTREQQREVAQYISTLAAFVEAKPDEFPLLAAEYEGDAETVTSALQQEAVRYFQETGVVASPKQVAQVLESALELHYEGLQRAYAKKRKPAPTAKSAAIPAESTSSAPSDAVLHDSTAQTPGGFSRERAEQQVYDLLAGKL